MKTCTWQGLPTATMMCSSPAYRTSTSQILGAGYVMLISVTVILPTWFSGPQPMRRKPAQANRRKRGERGEEKQKRCEWVCHRFRYREELTNDSQEPGKCSFSFLQICLRTPYYRKYTKVDGTRRPKYQRKKTNHRNWLVNAPMPLAWHRQPLLLSPQHHHASMPTAAPQGATESVRWTMMKADSHWLLAGRLGGRATT